MDFNKLTSLRRQTKLTDKARALVNQGTKKTITKRKTVEESSTDVPAAQKRTRVAQQDGVGLALSSSDPPNPRPIGSSVLSTASLGSVAEPSDSETGLQTAHVIHVPDDSEDVPLDLDTEPEETPKEQLGMSYICVGAVTNKIVVRLMKEWTSPIYAFYHPEPKIEVVRGRYSHVFRCQGKGCKASVRRFQDTGDARSTSNMHKHVKSCWGKAALDAAYSAANADDIRTKIVDGILRDGTITAAFERKSNGKNTYSNRPHTRAEAKAVIVRWVCESVRPFDIVGDLHFLSLMKTGRPEYYIPHPITVSRDVRLVFTRTRERIARMLNVSVVYSQMSNTYKTKGI